MRFAARMSGWVAVPLVVGAVTLVGTPANAAVGATFAITARCDGLGNPDGYVDLSGTFSGLLPVVASYSIVAVRAEGADPSATVVSDPWYPEADGSYVLAAGTFAYNGSAPGIVVRAGDAFEWQLHRTYGIDEVIASGVTSANGPSCTGEPPPPPPPPPLPPTPPAKADLSGSPAKITVSRAGRFAYPFRGPAGVHGTIRLKAAGKTWAAGSVTLSSTGHARPRLKLSAARLRLLKRLVSKRLRVTVVLTGAGGSSTAARYVRLRRPRR